MLWPATILPARMPMVPIQGQATQLRLIWCDFCISILRAQYVCTGIRTDMQVELLDVAWCMYLCVPRASNATLLKG